MTKKAFDTEQNAFLVIFLGKIKRIAFKTGNLKQKINLKA